MLEHKEKIDFHVSKAQSNKGEDYLPEDNSSISVSQLKKAIQRNGDSIGAAKKEYNTEVMKAYQTTDRNGSPRLNRLDKNTNSKAVLPPGLNPQKKRMARTDQHDFNYQVTK